MSTDPTRRDALRLVGAVGAGAAAAPLLAACAGAPKTTSGSGTFTVYWNAGHGYKAYEKVIAEFEKAHDVQVNLQKYQWEDMRTRLLADFSAGTVPDVVEATAGWAMEFAVSRNTRSLQDYVNRDGKAMGFPSDWQPNSVSRNTHQGKVYGVQLHLTCQQLVYNKTMFSQAGVRPPETWEDLLAAARKLTKDGVSGIALNQDYTYVWPWLLQAGITPYDPKTKRMLTPIDKAVEAMAFQADLVHEHKVSPVPVVSTDYSGPQKLLSAKRTAMIVTGPWDLEPIRKTGGIDFGVAPLPRHAEQATQLAGTTLFIPAKAAEPDLSWDFIKRITTLETERAAYKEAGMLMPRVSWARTPEVQGDPVTKTFADGLPYAIDPWQEMVKTGKTGKAEELLKTMYQDVVIRNRPAAQAVPAFVDDVRSLVGG